jgi:hypothetical protein
MTETIGLFVHYRPVVLALPPGGCRVVARYLGFENQDLLQQALDGAGLLYRHPELGPAVSSLLHAKPAESTIECVLHQSLMSIDSLTHRPQVFQWNPEAEVLVEPISIKLSTSDGTEVLELDLRMRSESALMPGAHCPPALIHKLKEQGNLWWTYGKGEELDGRERDSMDPAEESEWASILEQMGLTHVRPVELVKALDEFSDCAIDFHYSDAFIQSWSENCRILRMSRGIHYTYKSDWVIVDVGDDKIQGFC